MKIFPCLLKSLNIHSKKDFLYKDKSFYLSLEFKSNNSNDIYKLYEFENIDFYPSNLDSRLKDNIRFDEEEIIVSNVLFSSIEKLSINNANGLKLSFINCVFIKWIRFIGDPKHLSFDNCVINEYPSLPSENIYKIYFQSCSINKISYFGTLKDFDISGTYINTLEIIDITVDKFSMFFNKIDTFYINRIDSKNISCDPSQFIPVKSNSFLFIRKLKALINFSETNKKPILYEDGYLNGSLEYSLNTLLFLKEKTYFKHDSIAKSKIDYLIKILLNRNILIKSIFWPLGYFLRPSRIIIVSILTIIIFSCGYYMYDYYYLPSHYNYGYYFYKSITHFLFSIDSTFNGCLSIIQLIEKLLGIMLIASFPVSLVRKYLN